MGGMLVGGLSFTPTGEYYYLLLLPASPCAVYKLYVSPQRVPVGGFLCAEVRDISKVAGGIQMQEDGEEACATG